MQPIRLLLLDDHVLFRESLSRLLATEPDFEMTAHCGAASEALEALARSQVDVVLLDFDLGEDRGSRFLSAARQAGFSGKVLLVTAGMSAAECSMALQSGASGVFLKHNSLGNLAKAIRLVAAGDVWMDPKVVQLLAAGVREGDRAAERRMLTEREQQVLRGIFEGLSNKEIAARLGVSETAVKATLQQLFQKTGVRTRSQLVRIALEESLAGGRP